MRLVYFSAHRKHHLVKRQQQLKRQLQEQQQPRKMTIPTIPTILVSPRSSHPPYPDIIHILYSPLFPASWYPSGFPAIMVVKMSVVVNYHGAATVRSHAEAHAGCPCPERACCRSHRSSSLMMRPPFSLHPVQGAEGMGV